ncbi:Modular serine protease [Eumeta japonica]|uniref:Modular serine protease n=1 Tax=Eumeta variegata TaxID=151549 RepID=A0A4C1W470_EUMVA|nr:Modular serine protease [Eumeta japonica]
MLTAAHCFWNHIEGKSNPESRYAVAAGKFYRAWTDPHDESVQKSDVAKIEIPVRFRGVHTNFQEDIALVVLASSLVYEVHIRPVCVDFDILKEKRQLTAGALGKVAGWGLIDEEGNVTQTLQVANLPYIDIKQCLDEAPPDFREYITSDKICAGYVNGTGPCEGDSGGGLAFSELYGGERRYYLRGIVSTAPTNKKACNVRAVTTFTQIQSHELATHRLTFVKAHVKVHASGAHAVVVEQARPQDQHGDGVLEGGHRFFCAAPSRRSTQKRKLTFIPHVAKACKKAANIYKGLARAAKATWGLSSEVVRTIYITVIEPIVLYVRCLGTGAREVRHLGVTYVDRELEKPVYFGDLTHPGHVPEIGQKSLEDLDSQTFDRLAVVGPHIYTNVIRIEGKVDAALTEYRDGEER